MNQPRYSRRYDISLPEATSDTAVSPLLSPTLNHLVVSDGSPDDTERLGVFAVSVQAAAPVMRTEWASVCRQLSERLENVVGTAIVDQDSMVTLGRKIGQIDTALRGLQTVTDRIVRTVIECHLDWVLSDDKYVDWLTELFAAHQTGPASPRAVRSHIDVLHDRVGNATGNGELRRNLEAIYEMAGLAGVQHAVDCILSLPDTSSTSVSGLEEAIPVTTDSFLTRARACRQAFADSEGGTAQSQASTQSSLRTACAAAGVTVSSEIVGDTHPLIDAPWEQRPAKSIAMNQPETAVPVSDLAWNLLWAFELGGYSAVVVPDYSARSWLVNPLVGLNEESPGFEQRWKTALFRQQLATQLLDPRFDRVTCPFCLLRGEPCDGSRCAYSGRVSVIHDYASVLRRGIDEA